MRLNQDKVKQVNRLPFSVFETRYIPQQLLSYKAPNGDAYYMTFKYTRMLESDATSRDDDDTLERVLDTELEACFDLIERTSAKDYAASSSGWKPAAKRAEMREADMRFLLIRREKEMEAKDTPVPESQSDQSLNDKTQPESPTSPSLAKDQSILGFMSFMVTIEEGQNVVYIYEIHLEEALRGCGLGRHMFSITEEIGAAVGMTKAMLTVFRTNHNAMAMYENLGYGIDGISPGPRRLRGGVIKEPEYYIMSRRLQDKNHALPVELEGSMNKKRKIMHDGTVPS